MVIESQRLQAHNQGKKNWKQWGPYISERAWGTTREDYTPYGDLWNGLSHQQAHHQAFRWGEDAIAGVSDIEQYLCLGLTVWNGHDPVIKERLFGVTNPQGNHGEDVKEYYFHLDNTPTHSYMKYLYKYPQKEYPYADLVNQNQGRDTYESEYELLDTGIFANKEYFDITVEYAKAGPQDLIMKISVTNQGPNLATAYILPTLWFRNTWSWGYPNGPRAKTNTKPNMQLVEQNDQYHHIATSHPELEDYNWYLENPTTSLFTENETNFHARFGSKNLSKYHKDAFHRYLINNNEQAVNPENYGTKVAGLYVCALQPGDTQHIYTRLSSKSHQNPFSDHSNQLDTRHQEANDFYESIHKPHANKQTKLVQRQAWAGLLWSKQYYYFDVEQWIKGDPEFHAPPDQRKYGRNNNWLHLKNHDIILMPDKWEYPWYATWDLAFHCVAMAKLDINFAKKQLTTLVSERYQHPNGQLPSYENDFSSVNPPLHAWAAWKIYQAEHQMHNHYDRGFLEAIFHKLMFNFAWWLNRKDLEDKNLFQGGFLGLDNIGVFDRNDELPGGGHLDQADSTGWMAMYSLTMVKMSLELCKQNPVYQDVAIKFFDHFLRITQAMVTAGEHQMSLWDEHDGFYYDLLHLPHGESHLLKVRSLVGLLPLLATEILEPESLEIAPKFARNVGYILDQYPDLLDAGHIASCELTGKGQRRLLAIVNQDRLQKILQKMLDEQEFLSPYGIRSLSKVHQEHPYCFDCDGVNYSVGYESGESSTRMFGGNSNWRGPIWFPVNYLLIEALYKFYDYYGDDLKLSYPIGNHKKQNLKQIAQQISKRLGNLFLPDQFGYRPIFQDQQIFDLDPKWQNLLLFHEYFNADTGKGLGANHQTGWTSLIAELL